MDIGHQLKAARLRAGLSQEALASAAGMRVATISRAENGAEPRLGTVLSLASALNLSPGVLIDGVVPVEADLASDEVVLVQLFRGLEGRWQRLALELLRGLG
jgi:transcriptional regulator with XRE-family HTH domain